MNLTLRNINAYPAERLQALVDFAAPCFGEARMPVVVTFVRSRAWGRCSGTAYYPHQPRERRNVKPGAYHVRVRVPLGGTFPCTFTYRKASGPCTVRTLEELVLHTLAHELRHVEQFEACKGKPGTFRADLRTWAGSGGARGWDIEVDAELVAHGVLAGWQHLNP